MSRPTDKERFEKLSQLNGAEIQAPIIIDDSVIESVVNLEVKGADEEMFMNEMVEITIHSTGVEEEEPHMVFNVNGKNQAFFRDSAVTCRRMFLEVIARCKKTTYKQIQNPFDLERHELKANTVFVYPFSVTQDTPKGRAWLQAIKMESA